MRDIANRAAGGHCNIAVVVPGGHRHFSATRSQPSAIMLCRSSVRGSGWGQGCPAVSSHRFRTAAGAEMAADEIGSARQTSGVTRAPRSAGSSIGTGPRDECLRWRRHRRQSVRASARSRLPFVMAGGELTPRLPETRRASGRDQAERTCQPKTGVLRQARSR